MSENRVHLDIVGTAPSRFDEVIEWLLISLLAFAPLAFGAVEAWSEEIVLALAAAISICLLLKLVLQKSTRTIWSWAYVPVALFILVAVFQLIRLPTGLASIISPNTAATKQELLGDLPNSSELLSTMTLSFYPNATKHNLRLVLAIAAVFFVVVNVYRRPDQIKRLLGAIAIIGGSIAVLALAQDLLGNGKIYWLVPAGAGNAYSGPFVNHSHYGQFMNLSIGAALALILVKAHEVFTDKQVTPAVVIEYFGSSAAKTLWLLVAMIVLGAATIFVSLTRGGMVSMFVAAGFTTVVISLRKSLKNYGWIIALLAFGAFICVLYTGFDAVYDRLATLRELHQAEGGRWQIVKDIATAWTKFPLLGTGLGTHSVVYPMFDRSTIAALAAHAENEYAQAAEETGIVGLAALVGFGILVWASYIHNVRKADKPICSAAYGLAFGLLAIMIHSLSDFGQHLPANALLSGTFCALLLSLAHMGQKSNQITRAVKASRVSAGLRIAALICGSGVWAWVLLGANNARLAEAHWEKAHALEQSLMEEDHAASDEEYLDMISNTAAATDYQPDNVKYRHWLNVYRWQSISGISDPNTGEVFLSEHAIEIVRGIVDELHNSRLLCPTYGATYCVVGQLERSVLGDPTGAERIRKGFRLAPSDPAVCFVAGLLDIEDGHIDVSSAKLNRAVQLNGRFFRGVADIYVNYMDRPDLAVMLAGENTSRLSHIANLLAESDEHQTLAEQARMQVVELLKAKCQEPDAPAEAFASLANIYRMQKNSEAAIEHYRRALVLDYGQVAWRLVLTRLLAETGRIPDAIREARTCLRLSPQFKAAEKFLNDLSVLPGAVAEKNQVP